MRVVLDTSAVASVLPWQGPPTRLLQAACQQCVERFTSS